MQKIIIVQGTEENSRIKRFCVLSRARINGVRQYITQGSKCAGVNRKDVPVREIVTNIVPVCENMENIVPVHRIIKKYYYSFIHIAYYALCNFFSNYLGS